jgi:hypothetical protein
MMKYVIFLFVILFSTQTIADMRQHGVACPKGTESVNRTLFLNKTTSVLEVLREGDRFQRVLNHIYSFKGKYPYRESDFPVLKTDGEYVTEIILVESTIKNYPYTVMLVSHGCVLQVGGASSFFKKTTFGVEL